MKKNWAVVDNEGHCAMNDVTEEKAREEALRLNELEPDMEWEAIEED